MKQSRLMSLAEAVTNVAVGYGIAVATRIAVFPLFNITGRLAEHLVIGAIPRVKPEACFTGASILRSYALRRSFEAGRARKGRTRADPPSVIMT